MNADAGLFFRPCSAVAPPLWGTPVDESILVLGSPKIGQAVILVIYTCLCLFRQKQKTHTQKHRHKTQTQTQTTFVCVHKSIDHPLSCRYGNLAHYLEVDLNQGRHRTRTVGPGEVPEPIRSFPRRNNKERNRKAAKKKATSVLESVRKATYGIFSRQRLRYQHDGTSNSIVKKTLPGMFLRFE